MPTSRKSYPPTTLGGEKKAGANTRTLQASANPRPLARSQREATSSVQAATWVPKIPKTTANLSSKRCRASSLNCRPSSTSPRNSSRPSNNVSQAWAMEVEEVPFTELLSKIIDNRGRTCPTAETGLPLIATNCVRNDLLYPAFEKVRYVSQDTYEDWFRGHPEPGDLIFVCKGTPGRVCMTPNPVSFCIAQDMVAVRADPKKVYPRYLFALLRSPTVQTHIGNMHVGTLIPHFKKGDFDKLLLPVPDQATSKTLETINFNLP